MKLAYAYVSDTGDSYSGLMGEATFRFKWEGLPGDTPPRAPLSLHFVVGLIEGEPGSHTFTLMVTAPSDLTDVRNAGSDTFHWETGYQFQHLHMPMTLNVTPGRGIVEFTLLVDGVPLGKTYLPIDGHAARIEPDAT